MNPPGGAGLAQAAREEADAVDRELKENPELAQQAKRPDISIVGDQTEGHEEPSEPKSQPGEQGSATQDDDPEEQEAQPFTRPATEDQIANAKKVRLELSQRAQHLGPTVVAEMLLQCVDIDPLVTFPTAWGHGEARYAKSEVLSRIGTIMLRGFHEKLELSPSDVEWRFRNSKNWTKQGVLVLCEAKIVPAWARDMTDDVKVVVFANFQAFRLMNTLRRVKAMYHALRGIDDEAHRIPPHFYGWYDELEIFGPMTFEDEVRLVNAIDRGKERRNQVAPEFQLDLLAGAAE